MKENNLIIKRKPNYFILLKIILLVALIFAALNSAEAQIYNETIAAINQSRADIQEMIDAGFSVLRVSDILAQAEQLFSAQSALMKEGGTPDFSLVIVRTNEISKLRIKAEEVYDELEALKVRVKEAGAESEANDIFAKAEKEFNDERYDESAELIESAYAKIIEEEALQTKVRAIYAAGSKTIFDFLKEKWEIILSIILFIVISYLYFKKKINLYLINKKIRRLEFKKNILNKLIENTQYDYFHLFKISEQVYHIRITQYGELIRDVNRQIPLLAEEKEKLKKSWEKISATGEKKFGFIKVNEVEENSKEISESSWKFKLTRIFKKFRKKS